MNFIPKLSQQIDHFSHDSIPFLHKLPIPKWCISIGLKSIFLFSIGLPLKATAAVNIIDFFQQALHNDPTYQQVLEQTLANDENIAINRSSLLPHVVLKSTPQANTVHNYGAIIANGIYPPFNKLNSFDTQLNINQTIIDFAILTDLSNAKLSSKQAHAQLNAAFQDLILRVAQAYLKVLYDEEYLADCKANEKAFMERLSQAKQLYKANSINESDVCAAESSYKNAQSRSITAQAILATDKDFLATIAGREINELAKLRDNFPISLPKPQNKEAWVQTAKNQNWNIKSSAFAVKASKEMIKKSIQGHLPTVSMQLTYEVQPFHSAESSLIYAAGSSNMRNAAVALNFNLPLYSGGLVVAKTNQAQHNYQLAQRKFDAVFRNTLYMARQSYLNINSSIQKIKADKISIQAAISALKGIKVRYDDGSVTIVDLLNQQEKVLQAQTQYALDKHEYINNLISLKNAAGNLSLYDLEIINSWLL